MTLADIRPLADVEKECILEAIKATGSISRAAIRLEISRDRIRRVLRKNNIAMKVNEITAELRKQRKLL